MIMLTFAVNAQSFDAKDIGFNKKEKANLSNHDKLSFKVSDVNNRKLIKHRKYLSHRSKDHKQIKRKDEDISKKRLSEINGDKNYERIQNARKKAQRISEARKKLRRINDARKKAKRISEARKKAKRLSEARKKNKRISEARKKLKRITEARKKSILKIKDAVRRKIASNSRKDLK